MADPHDIMRIWYATASVLSLVLIVGVVGLYVRDRHRRGLPASNRFGLVILGGVLLLGTSAWSGVAALEQGFPPSHRTIWLTASTTLLLAGLIGVAAGQRKNRS